MARGGRVAATRSMSFAIVVLSPTDVDAKRARDAARRLMSLHKLPRGFRRFPATPRASAASSARSSLDHGARRGSLPQHLQASGGELGKEAHSSFATRLCEPHLPARHHRRAHATRQPAGSPTITPNAAAQRRAQAHCPSPPRSPRQWHTTHSPSGNCPRPAQGSSMRRSSRSPGRSHPAARGAPEERLGRPPGAGRGGIRAPRR